MQLPEHRDFVDNPRLQAALLLSIVGVGTAAILLLSFVFKDIEGEGSLNHDLLLKALAWKRDQRILSESYRRSMNRAVDPCTDFESFVCGNSASMDVFSDMHSRMLAAAGRYLAHLNVPSGSGGGSSNLTALEKAASLFQLCISLPSLEDDAAPKLFALLRQLGLGWSPEQPGFVEESPTPTRSEAEALLAKLVALSLRWGFHTLLHCAVEPERKLGGSLVLTVRSSDELSDWLVTRAELVPTNKYNEALVAVVGAFRWPGGLQQSVNVVRGIASADRLLSALVSNSSLWSGTRISAESWRRMASQVAGRPVAPSVQPSALLSVLEYFVLKMTDDAAVAAAWLMLRKLAPLSAAAPPGEKEEQRSRYCIHTIYRGLPLPVASAYAHTSDTAANDSTVTAAGVVIHDVAAKMIELLEASGRFRIAENLRTMGTIFTLPVDDAVVDSLYESVPAADARRTLFGSLAEATNTMAERRLAALGSRLDNHTLPLFARPLDVRLHYLEPLHALQVPMSVLEPPLFRQTLTTSVNYGSFGRLVAQVLIENFVKNPNVTKPCDEAADNFTTTMLRDAAVERPVGRAFQGQLNNRSVPHEVRLLGFQDFSDEQTFFIAGCYVRCGAVAHCSTAFRHNRWFSAAFGCGQSARMNPEERCAFW